MLSCHWSLGEQLLDVVYNDQVSYRPVQDVKERVVVGRFVFINININIMFVKTRSWSLPILAPEYYLLNLLFNLKTLVGEADLVMESA